MKVKKWILWLLCVLLLLVSCKTAPVTEQKEPVDLKPSITMLFDTRPKDENFKIIEDVQTLDDIIDNSAAYLMAWELWEVYAESLERYIVNIGDLELYSL